MYVMFNRSLSELDMGVNSIRSFDYTRKGVIPMDVSYKIDRYEKEHVKRMEHFFLHYPIK
jgi:hypothetical protein